MTNEYKKYKLQLREEFSYACGYCEIREPELGGTKSFHIDHYRPQKKFPLLLNEYSNLIYACRDCNTHKKDYWPTTRQKLVQEIILNPRLDKNKIAHHINKTEVIWRGNTRQGIWNILRLNLSSVDKIKRRQDRITIEKAIKKFQQDIEEYQALLEKNLSNEKQTEALNNISSLQTLIDTLKRKIHGPTD